MECLSLRDCTQSPTIKSFSAMVRGTLLTLQATPLQLVKSTLVPGSLFCATARNAMFCVRKIGHFVFHTPRTNAWSGYKLSAEFGLASRVFVSVECDHTTALYEAPTIRMRVQVVVR